MEMDIADAGVVEAIAKLKPEVVIHAAAQVSVVVSMQDPHLDLAVNVQGTANVLEGAKAAGTRRFVFASSGGGLWRIRWRPGRALPRPMSYCGAHKYLGEHHASLSGLSYANAWPTSTGLQAALGPRGRGSRHLHRGAPERAAHPDQRHG